jgi:hypothetical protein
LPEAVYINASCIISERVVYKNEAVVFENDQTDLQGFLAAAYQHFGIRYPRFYKMDNLSRLGWLAAEILLKDSFTPGQYPPENIALVLSNASSSLDTDIKYFATTKEIASPALFVYTLPNIVMGEICIRHNFKGENAFFISEDFDPGFIQQYVQQLFNNNNLQACICGWVELLGDQYKTVLFLTEKVKHNWSVVFSMENINKTYRLYNG